MTKMVLKNMSHEIGRMALHDTQQQGTACTTLTISTNSTDHHTTHTTPTTHIHQLTSAEALDDHPGEEDDGLGGLPAGLQLQLQVPQSVM